MKHKLTKGSEFGCCLFFKKKKKEKKVLNYIAVRTSTQSFWEIFRMAAKRCLVSLCVQTALLIPWVSDVTGINIARAGGAGVRAPPAKQSYEGLGRRSSRGVVSGVLVEVYNCATGSADCSQCLGREDLGHRCVWSESSSSCRLHGEGTPLSDVCPAPEIRKVRPSVTRGVLVAGQGGAGLGPAVLSPLGTQEGPRFVPGTERGQDRR